MPSSDEQMARFYEMACELLQKEGYIHNEISNWSRPDQSCDHNWLYWGDGGFMALGAGAHGYLPDQSVGTRFSYSGDLRKYLRETAATNWQGGATLDEGRGGEEWLMEYIGCALRCSRGVSLELLRQKGFDLKPHTPILKRAVQEGLLSWDNNRVTLVPREWFRETAWSLALVEAAERVM